MHPRRESIRVAVSPSHCITTFRFSSPFSLSLSPALAVSVSDPPSRSLYHPQASLPTRPLGPSPFNSSESSPTHPLHVLLADNCSFPLFRESLQLSVRYSCDLSPPLPRPVIAHFTLRVSLRTLLSVCSSEVRLRLPSLSSLPAQPSPLVLHAFTLPNLVSQPCA